MAFRRIVDHATQHMDKALDKVPVPAQATANVIGVAAAEAMQWDWLRIMTGLLIVIQIVYWIDRLARQWGWWGRSCDEKNR